MRKVFVWTIMMSGCLRHRLIPALASPSAPSHPPRRPLTLSPRRQSRLLGACSHPAFVANALRRWWRSTGRERWEDHRNRSRCRHVRRMAKQRSGRNRSRQGRIGYCHRWLHRRSGWEGVHRSDDHFYWGPCLVWVVIREGRACGESSCLVVDSWEHWGLSYGAIDGDRSEPSRVESS